MSNRLNIRCSSLPRYFKCSAAMRLNKSVLESSEAAKNGTMQHEHVLNDFMTERYESNEYVKFIHDSRGEICGIEDNVSAHYKEFSLTGSVDFWVYYSSKTFQVVDLKTGDFPVSPLSPQLFAYALLIYRRLIAFNLKADQFILTIFQFNESKSVTLGTQELLKFEQDLIDLVDRSKHEEFTTGTHCNFCESKFYCPKIGGMVKQYTPSINDESQKLELLKNKTTIEKMLEEIKCEFLTDGKYFTLKERKTKAWINESVAPTEPMSPAKALKLGLAKESDFKYDVQKIKYLDLSKF